MRLLHYSPAPFLFDRQRKYVADRWNFKPMGLWLSVDGDDDWPAWCNGENFHLESLKYVTEITMRPDANILLIDSPAKLDAFDKRFRATIGDHIRNIQWSAVADAYDGMIIAPYQWSRRLDLMWYYCWDCASGVVWNLSAVSGAEASVLLGPSDRAMPASVPTGLQP